MTDMILAALKATGIDNYIITSKHTEAAELYFIRKKVDMPRFRDITEYTVKVFNDFEADGVKMRGESEITVFPGTSAIELEAQLIKAYGAAGYVKNEYYELYAPKKSDLSFADDGIPDTPEQLVEKASKALFAADRGGAAFVNSAEFFGTVKKVRIISSAGVDVSFVKHRIFGELVAQCKEPEDVEQHRWFDLNPAKTEELTAITEEVLKAVKDRASAKEAPEAGKYDVILSGEHLKTVLDYFLSRAHAWMIYPGYSDWAEGTAVQGDSVSGDLISMDVFQTDPFSSEGIPMPDRTLISGGRLKFVQGETRLSRYLGNEPTGSYANIRMKPGKVSVEELKKGSLYPVSFSDFQLDPQTGFFGGEIRLAYLYTGNGVKILTGGSINGNINDVLGNIVFSSEKYTDSSYEGPFAAKFRGVRVAGR